MNIDRIANQVATGISGSQEPSISQGQSTQSAPILGGASVKVTDGFSTDLEKLILQLKEENASTQQALAQRRISLLATVLDGMTEQVSQQEAAAMLEIEKLNSANTVLEAEIADLQSEKAAAATASQGYQSQISESEKAAAASDAKVADLTKQIASLKAGVQSEAIQAQIETLEKLVENEIKNGEAHRKQIAELKEKKAEEDKKILACENAIASKTNEIATNKARSSQLIASVSAATMRIVAAAVAAAAEATEIDGADESESVAEREKAEKKAEANNPAFLLREALDKLDAEITKTFEKNQAIKA
jgi:chromosome segregation ATPase